MCEEWLVVLDNVQGRFRPAKSLLSEKERRPLKLKYYNVITLYLYPSLPFYYCVSPPK